MREIKFRAWDKACNQMVAPDKIYLNGEVVISECWATSDVILMQYTGLKDKNGVEIYESDVVQWVCPDTDKVDSGIIEWDETFAGFGITGEHCLDWCHVIEVIGNIYENPELLEAKQ